ncbi:MAG TPA: copper amine oxidase N-terminal domain-containing protein [Bacillus bacterium]|nr:copper amine oxidase N-terminal domain-containing protein [Bacillus sp. (in: firmicutes)]
MKMAKIIPIAMTALLVGSTTVATTTFATTVVPIEQEQVQPVFIKTTGTIESIDVRMGVSYYSIKEGENTNTLVVTADTFVFDNTGKRVELKKSDKVTAYTYANKPMIMIYPPQYNPEVVIVETEAAGFAAVGTFDKNLVDANLSLKLNVGDETELSSLSGKKVKIADLAEQNLLVFYTITTRSIPAQTSPQKIVVLDQEEPSQEIEESNQEIVTNPVVEEIIAKDYYEVDGTKMVPLRALAEELGYKVDATSKGAILTKGAQTYTITRGEKVYSHNEALRYFEVAPALLEPGKTYVPVQFIQELIN